MIAGDVAVLRREAESSYSRRVGRLGGRVRLQLRNSATQQYLHSTSPPQKTPPNTQPSRLSVASEDRGVITVSVPFPPMKTKGSLDDQPF